MSDSNRTSPRPEIILRPLTEEDLIAVAEAGILAFDRTNDPIDMGINGPHEMRPTMEDRIAIRAQGFHRDLLLPSSLPASFPRPQPIVACLSSPSSPAIGLAIWHPPLDRTSTSGDPLPAELSKKEEDDKREKSEFELRMEVAVDGEFRKRFGDEMKRVKKEVLGGEKCWYLQLVFVHPDYQGLGVAQRLLEYGMRKAEEDGVVCYLESADKARSFYVKNGFEISAWGKHDGIEWPAFKREPKAKKSFESASVA